MNAVEYLNGKKRAMVSYGSSAKKDVLPEDDTKPSVVGAYHGLSRNPKSYVGQSLLLGRKAPIGSPDSRRLIRFLHRMATTCSLLLNLSEQLRLPPLCAKGVNSIYLSF